MLGFAVITALISLTIPTRELETLTSSSREPESVQVE
jgi:hypothetical protein